jgi:hypothetical protein
MTGDVQWSWLALALLGAGHGLNPGMGWLFAVALGLQQRKAGAVWRALPPLALGHAVAVMATVVVVTFLGSFIDFAALRWILAAALILFGLDRMFRARHPRFGGMVVGPWDITVWSAVMALAHGAGLMLIPFLLDPAATSASTAHVHHGEMLAPPGGAGIPFAAVHTGSYLAVTGLMALLVYRWCGLRFLRTHWVNLDLVWGAVLILTGAATAIV